MKRIWVVLALMTSGCDSGKAKVVAQTGSGSGSSSSCNFEGSYLLRFHSNGADGWWLAFTVTSSKLAITGGATNMLGLEGVKPRTVYAAENCSLMIAATTKQAGDLKIALKVAPDGAVTGKLSRTDDVVSKGEPVTAVTGRHDITPAARPACIVPGIYKLAADPKTKWKLVQGHPRGPLNCTNSGELDTTAFIRVTLFGKDLYVDEVDSEKHEQGFSRGVLTRDSECAITLAYERQDLHLSGAKLVFAGDKISGSADTMGWDFMEDGDAGENLWKCGAEHVGLTGTRIAD